jgi:hypothetical protein
MSIIKASIVEVEVQEQTVPDAGSKFMVVVRYEPDGKQQSDILQIILTDQKPIIKETMDLGDRVVEKNVATTTKPKDVTTPEQLLGLEGSHE